MHGTVVLAEETQNGVTISFFFSHEFQFPPEPSGLAFLPDPTAISVAMQIQLLPQNSILWQEGVKYQIVDSVVSGCCREVAARS
jgi:hypothetical protein